MTAVTPEHVMSPEKTAGAEALQIVGFLLGGEEYSIPILDVTSVERLQNVRHFPRMPDFIEGVTRIQDEIVPLVRLRNKLGFPHAEHSDATRVIVVELNDELIGFIVESVTGVKRFTKADLEPAPKLALSVDAPFVRGVFRVEERMVVLLDAHRILTPEEYTTIGEVAQIAQAARRDEVSHG